MDNKNNATLPRPNAAVAAKVITVIETEGRRGRGTEDDLHRVVRQYWSLDGTFLAENDSTVTYFPEKPPVGGGGESEYL